MRVVTWPASQTKASCIIERNRGIHTVWKVLAGLVILMVASLVLLVVRASNIGAPTATSPSRLQDEPVAPQADELPTVEPETDTVPSEIDPRQKPEERPPHQTQGPWVGGPVSPGISPNARDLPTIVPQTDTVPVEINPRQNPRERPTP